MQENLSQFEQRKREHIQIALEESSQAYDQAKFDQIRLIHNAFPEIDFSDIDITTKVCGELVHAPLFISSMTGGHKNSISINTVLASASEERGWAMGVGSQRREIIDDGHREWQTIRKIVPHAKLFSNLGISQIIRTSPTQILKLIESSQAIALIVHTNPLQECLQHEGTPQFKGGFQALETLAKALPIPVIVKETGCGFSKSTLKRLDSTGVHAVDVSGLGGTHWGRVEGARAPAEDKRRAASHVFKNWGIHTVDSIISAVSLNPSYKIWASGGVRSGLDAAKLIAIGAQMVGFAKPIIERALISKESLLTYMECLEFELKVAMFCTGSAKLSELQAKGKYCKNAHPIPSQ